MVQVYNPKFDKSKRQVGLTSKYVSKTSAPAPAGKTGAGTGTVAALEKAKAMYAPGGAYGAGLDAQLQRGQKKAVAGGMQAMVSSGLASTSMPAGLAKQYEEEIATPARANLESERARALANISMTEAGMQFQSGEASLDRSLTREMGTAGMGAQLAAAGMNKPKANINSPWTIGSTQKTASAPAAAPVARQHAVTGGSGMNSFLTNLRGSGEVNPATGTLGGWAKGFWE